MKRRLAIILLALGACGGSGSEAPVCQRSEDPQLAVAFCAPAAIAANQPLRLQIQEQCGGCERRADRCEVQVVLEADLAQRLVDSLKTALPAPDVIYWITPVTGMGRLA